MPANPNARIPRRRGISFDAVAASLLEHAARAVEAHRARLTAAFLKFDEGDAGAENRVRCFVGVESLLDVRRGTIVFDRRL